MFLEPIFAGMVGRCDVVVKGEGDDIARTAAVQSTIVSGTPSGDVPFASDQPRDLSAIVREKLATGDLPKGEEASLTLNLGLISACDACGSPITGREYIHG